MSKNCRKFRVGNWLIGLLSETLFFWKKMSEILRLLGIFLTSKKAFKKRIYKYNLIQFFFSQSLVSCERISDLLQINERFAHLLFDHEHPERIAHGRSFVMSVLSDLLTVPHLSWAIWANRSQSLIKMINFEWMSKWAMSEWANERIPNSAKIRITCRNSKPI